jgi:hypothetical protein
MVGMYGFYKTIAYVLVVKPEKKIQIQMLGAVGQT